MTADMKTCVRIFHDGNPIAGVELATDRSVAIVTGRTARRLSRKLSPIEDDSSQNPQILVTALTPVSTYRHSLGARLIGILVTLLDRAGLATARRVSG